MKSTKFDAVKCYYDTGLWKTNRLRDAVVKNWITEEEYEEITGERYDNDNQAGVISTILPGA